MIILFFFCSLIINSFIVLFAIAIVFLVALLLSILHFCCFSPRFVDISCTFLCVCVSLLLLPVVLLLLVYYD